jgi:hypothetical protein
MREGKVMAGPAPKTRAWFALENAHKPKGLHVIVTGAVQVSATDKAAVLTEAPSVGDLLALDLAIKDEGHPGVQVQVWKPAYFHKEVSANEYNRVVVRWDGKPIATFPVLDDRECGAMMDKRTQAENASAAKSKKAPPKGTAPKKPAPRKPAPKKPAPKKPAPKKAAKKKAPKRAGPTKRAKKAKKAPKKAARKSGLNKLVRRIVKTLTPAKKKKRR